MNTITLTRIIAFALLLSFEYGLHAEDWPTYLKNNSRTGASTESLNFPLSQQWSIEPTEPPQKSWPGPDGRVFERKLLRSRMTFDDAFHVAVVDDHLYYGNSVDHQVYCVDTETGNTVWNFFTEGPVRLAPTVWQEKVFVGSDDGHVYCLNAADGSLIWKMRPGPSGERILGRQEMISRWPVRTGVTIQETSEHGPIACFGAGVFPHENIFLLAVNAETGKEIWKIDNLSQDSAGRNDLSPQGYSLANKEILVVPSGRSLPAVFDIASGELLHKKRHSWRTDAGGVVGGTQALLSDGQIYAWGAHHILAMDQKSGDVGFGWFAGHQMAVAGDAAWVANGIEIARLDRAAYAANSAVRHKLEMAIYKSKRALSGDKEKDSEAQKKIDSMQKEHTSLADVGFVWKTPSPHESRLIVTANAIIAGGENEVLAFDIETGKEIWKSEVDGEARGLAVSNGKLYASTTKGDIVCFGSGESSIQDTIRKESIQPDHTFSDAAEAILKATGIRNGFCLVAGVENGGLALDLARQSNLEIICIDSDPDKVALARNHIAHEGFYGSRISVHQGELDAIPYARYFANLIVSETAVSTGKAPESLNPKSLATHLKPLGGKIVLGPDNSTGFVSWLSGSGLEEVTVTEKDGFAILERGALPGAGDWSHQYGEPGNTACSYDYRVKGGLGVLWFGDPGEGQMVNRHDGAVGPLAINGRLFAQGETRIMAYDAYNGLFLWERENPDSIRTGVFQNQNPGNLVASPDRLFFMEREKCIELDAATGEEVAVHLLPEEMRGESHEWGYVAWKDGILYGTATVREEIEERKRRRGRATDDLTDGIFAIDTKSGKHLWSYHGNTIEHRTVAIGEGAVYFIDSTLTSEQRDAVLRQNKEKFANLSPEEVKNAEAKLKEQDLRLAVGINSRTGEKMWEQAVDVTDCSDIGIGGGKLTLLFRNNVLVLCGANANGHYWKQFMDGEFSKRRLVALSGTDGAKMWSRDANYRHRPIVIDDEIIAEPWSYDLYTGEQKMRENPLTGEQEPWSMMRNGHHCGMMVGTPNLLAFRSGFTSFYDMEEDIGTNTFAGHRTGCWINAIPANGLISIPESSAGCVCLFSISSTIVMEPRAERKDWAMFSSTGAKTPVKNLALNFGAPGDRRDEKGNAWLAFPRPKPERQTSLDLDLNFNQAFEKGGGYVTLNENSAGLDLNNLSNPAPKWVYTSRGNGMLLAEIPLLGEKDSPATYTVRVHMAVPKAANKESGERVFNLRLQGKELVEEIRIPANQHSPIVREFKGIEVTDTLRIEQFTKTKDPEPEQMAVLNGVEIIRE